MMRAKIRQSTIQNVRIVNSYRTHFSNNISWLRSVLLFSRIVDLNSWIVAATPYFLLVTEVSQLFSLSPTLTGVSGSGHRLRLATPSWPMPTYEHELGPSIHHHICNLKKEFAMTKNRVVRKVDFYSQPEIGTILMKEGQRYELVAHEPHVRADGRQTTLLVWQSHCAETGHPFEIKTGLKVKYINRRCKQHSKPGQPVAASKHHSRFSRVTQSSRSS